MNTVELAEQHTIKLHSLQPCYSQLLTHTQFRDPSSIFLLVPIICYYSTMLFIIESMESIILDTFSIHCIGREKSDKLRTSARATEWICVKSEITKSSALCEVLRFLSLTCSILRQITVKFTCIISTGWHYNHIF